MKGLGSWLSDASSFFLKVFRILKWIAGISLIFSFCIFLSAGCDNHSKYYVVFEVKNQSDGECNYSLEPSEGISHRGSTLNIYDDCGKYQCGDTLKFVLK